MKINAKLALVAITTGIITSAGAFANEVEFVQGFNGSGQGSPISFYRPVQKPRISTVGVYAARHRIRSSVTAGDQQKSQSRWATILTGSQSGQATFYRSAH
jgi:hypothetical protein